MLLVLKICKHLSWVASPSLTFLGHTAPLAGRAPGRRAGGAGGRAAQEGAPHAPQQAEAAPLQLTGDWGWPKGKILPQTPSLSDNQAKERRENVSGKHLLSKVSISAAPSPPNSSLPWSSLRGILSIDQKGSWFSFTFRFPACYCKSPYCFWIKTINCLGQEPKEHLLESPPPGPAPCQVIYRLPSTKEHLVTSQKQI